MQVELTYRDCLADLIRRLDNEIHPLWLVTDKTYQDEALQKADEYYEEWKETELRRKANREKGIAQIKARLRLNDSR